MSRAVTYGAVPTIRRRAPAAFDPRAWPAAFPRPLARAYAARGVARFDDARVGLARLAAPELLGGIDRAARLIADAIVDDQHIVLAGDYDADGATGCAVGVRGLRLFGATRVGYAVPNRVTHGYGLSPRLAAEIAARGADLVITVDNGINAHDGVAAANARGMRVVVTDHHLPGTVLPAAAAIVNPNLAGDGFPSKALAGVGVMFYVLIAIRAVLRARGWFGTARPEPDLRTLVDLVALGTVADMVALDDNNRALVGAGLKRIRDGHSNLGIAALFAVAARDPKRASAQDFGFAVAPRINAAGRLDDIAVGIECLLTDDPAEATRLAALLDDINRTRREVQGGMQAEADAAIARALGGGARMPPGLTMFDPDWHQGVVGLIASKLKDRCHRPVVAFAPVECGSSSLRGSARSIAGVHVRDVLAAIDTRAPGLIERFGGHAMAAGLTLDRAQLDVFSKVFASEVRERIGGDPEAPEIVTDGELAEHEATAALALAIRDGGPWGQGFDEPSFDGAFDVESTRVVGETHLAMKLRFPGGRSALDAIHFGGVDDADPVEPGDRVHLVYQLTLDEWRGEQRLRLLVRQRQAP